MDGLARAELRRLCAVLLACLIAAFAAPPVPAQPATATGHQIHVSTRGDNRNDGASPARPLRTIMAAVAKARPGDTIAIEAGTYHEQVVTARAGAAGAEIVLRSVNGVARIDGSTLGWRAGRNQNQGLVELRHPYIRLAGLAVVNSKNTGVLLDASNLTVEGCQIADTRLHGISTETSHQTKAGSGTAAMLHWIAIRNNTVERTALAGNSQAISLIADGFVVAGNTVRNSPKEGIDIWLGSRRGSVEGNTVYGNDRVGIYVDGAAYVSIARNVVTGNLSGIGISSEDARYETHDIWVYNNLVRDNRRDGVFLWDEPRHPGFRGSQHVLIAHNTLIGNGTALHFSGGGNSGWATGNLGLSREDSVVFDPDHRKGIELAGNVWLDRAQGFVAADRGNFDLAEDSPARGKARALPTIASDPGLSGRLGKDFEGRARPTGDGADAGAFQYQPQPAASSNGGGSLPHLQLF